MGRARGITASITAAACDAFSDVLGARRGTGESERETRRPVALGEEHAEALIDALARGEDVFAQALALALELCAERGEASWRHVLGRRYRGARARNRLRTCAAASSYAVLDPALDNWLLHGADPQRLSDVLYATLFPSP